MQPSLKPSNRGSCRLTRPDSARLELLLNLLSVLPYLRSCGFEGDTTPSYKQEILLVQKSKTEVKKKKTGVDSKEEIENIIYPKMHSGEET